MNPFLIFLYILFNRLGNRSTSGSYFQPVSWGIVFAAQKSVKSLGYYQSSNCVVFLSFQKYFFNDIYVKYTFSTLFNRKCMHVREGLHVSDLQGRSSQYLFSWFVGQSFPSSYWCCIWDLIMKIFPLKQNVISPARWWFLIIGHSSFDLRNKRRFVRKPHPSASFPISTLCWLFIAALSPCNHLCKQT